MFARFCLALAAMGAVMTAALGVARAGEPAYGPNTLERTLQSLAAHEAMASAGGWPAVPAAVSALRPGAEGPGVAALKQRLHASGDLAQADLEGDVYSPAVVEAVKRFQRRHGLSDLGTVGRLTLKAMNTPVETRISQLKATAERLKGNGFSFARRYVVVNIPGASVEAVEDGQVRNRHLAIVGRPDRPSPVLQANITSVNLNPFWTVPTSIVKADIIPNMRKDPAYLAKSNMRLIGAGNAEIDPASVDWAKLVNPYFYVRQDPGPANALGQLKIDMPNTEAVYMHDTPGKSRFRSDIRFNSSGCARVEGVRDLAAWLLENTDWNRQRIEDEIARGERKNIILHRSVPVAWVYMTGWQDAAGVTQFREDIYGLDTPGGIAQSTVQARKTRVAAPRKPAAGSATAAAKADTDKTSAARASAAQGAGARAPAGKTAKASTAPEPAPHSAPAQPAAPTLPPAQFPASVAPIAAAGGFQPQTLTASN